MYYTIYYLFKMMPSISSPILVYVNKTVQMKAGF